MTDTRPLVAHVVYRFAVGGLENGLVNLLNHLPGRHYRHAVISLTDMTDFVQRVTNPEVEFHSLHKPPGQTWKVFPKIYRRFMQLRPAIVHSRNLAALETQLPALVAGVPARIHGEHGFLDINDDRVGFKAIAMRKAYRPCVNRYVTVSASLAKFLEARVSVSPERITQIYNGVDCSRFSPGDNREAPPAPDAPFRRGEHFIIGTVGRMQAEKDQVTLARAFVSLLEKCPALASRLRLAMIGDGPLRTEVEQVLTDAGHLQLAWLPGGRNDIAEQLRGFDLFVLPSRGEGISNTILEAMATGLPVIATAVGGSVELVEEGVTGMLVGAQQAEAMAACLEAYVHSPGLLRQHGECARRTAESRFSLTSMISAYDELYMRMLASSAALRLSSGAH